MSTRRPWPCRLLGCRWDFAADGSTLYWACRRCARHGERRYAEEAAARRMAAALNRGAPGPPLGLLAALGGTLHREPRLNRPR